MSVKKVTFFALLVALILFVVNRVRSEMDIEIGDDE